MKKYDEITHAKYSSIRDVFEPRTHREEQLKEEKAVSQTSLTAQNLVPRSLFIFSRRNVLRRTLIKLTTSKRFDIFVSLLICLNCIVFGINDYNSANAQTWRDDVNIYFHGWNTLCSQFWNSSLGIFPVTQGMTRNQIKGEHDFRVEGRNQ